MPVPIDLVTNCTCPQNRDKQASRAPVSLILSDNFFFILFNCFAGHYLTELRDKEKKRVCVCSSNKMRLNMSTF